MTILSYILLIILPITVVAIIYIGSVHTFNSIKAGDTIYFFDDSIGRFISSTVTEYDDKKFYYDVNKTNLVEFTVSDVFRGNVVDDPE